MTQREEWEHYVGLNWTNRFDDDPDEEEVIYFDLIVDACKLSDEEFNEILNQLDNLNYGDSCCPKANFSVDYVYKDDEEYATGFTLSGWADEETYEEIQSTLDYWCVKVSDVA